MRKSLLYLTILIFISTVFLKAQITAENAFPNLTFSSPVFLTYSPDNTDRIFVIEQAGRIRVFENSSNVLSAKVFLDITDRVLSGGERGLLGLAFHPDYESNGYFYVNYTFSTNGNDSTRIARFKVTSNPDSSDKNSEFQVLKFDQPYSNHNGGWIGFGPEDGYLYIGTGDGGSGGDPENRAQNINVLLGKILRIDVDGGNPYAIPDTNPFYDSTNTNIKKEIYAWGMRNPWRCSFDPETGWLWAGDVGQGAWEEIDLINNGKNYGWRCYEGNHTYNTLNCNYPEYVFPVWEYPHSKGCSITGGYVYRGPTVPELYGKYIYGDYCSSKIWALTYDGITPPTNQLLLTTTDYLPSFGVDQNQELCWTSFNGRIYKFSPTATSTETDVKLNDYSLEQNYPNPFNPTTIIKYSVPEESEVAIKIYDAIGKEIDSITTGVLQKGAYQKTWNAKEYASGIYFVKMNAKSLVSEKTYSHIVKMLYMK